jgi:ABC-2 type transport system permease protein
MNIGYLYSSMLSEFLRFRRIGVWLIVCFALAGMALLFVYVNPTVKGADLYPMLSGMLVFRFLPLVAAIFSMAVLAQEVEQKTIVYMLTRPIPRPQMLLMRTLAAATVVAILTFIAATLVSIGVFGPAGLSSGYLWRDLKAIIVGAGAYCSLFVFVSLLMNRAMVVCLLFAFAWETSVPNMPGNMYYLSITSYLTAIAERPSGGELEASRVLGFFAGALGQNTLTPTFAWVVMGGLIVGCLAIGMTWFSRFEYLPREDAE